MNTVELKDYIKNRLPFDVKIVSNPRGEFRLLDLTQDKTFCDSYVTYDVGKNGIDLEKVIVHIENSVYEKLNQIVEQCVPSNNIFTLRSVDIESIKDKIPDRYKSEKYELITRLNLSLIHI